MKTPPPVPVPPATPGAQQPPVPYLPALTPAATLSLLIKDGIIEAGTRGVDFYLSNKEFIVNNELQSAELRVKYHKHFGLINTTGTDIISMKIG